MLAIQDTPGGGGGRAGAGGEWGTSRGRGRGKGGYSSPEKPAIVAKSADEQRAAEWLNVPPGVPYVDTQNPAPSQTLMDGIMAGTRAARAPGGGGPGGPEGDVFADANAYALALVHAPGVDMPESLSAFKVLSADIIDRIWAQLKEMVEEDSADLVRRQRQRDERYRMLMKLMPEKTDGASQIVFEGMYKSEITAHAGEDVGGDGGTSSPMGGGAGGTFLTDGGVNGMNGLGGGAMGGARGGMIPGVVPDTPADPRGMMAGSMIAGQTGGPLGVAGGGLVGHGGLQNQMQFAGQHPQQLQQSMMSGTGVAAGQGQMPIAAAGVPGVSLAGAPPHVQEEVSKLRDLINQQQSTLLSQQQALAEATRALEEVRRDKETLFDDRPGPGGGGSHSSGDRRSGSRGRHHRSGGGGGHHHGGHGGGPAHGGGGYAVTK